MLAGLRHKAFIGRDHQQSRLDAADASQHIFNKIAVSRHVNNADGLTIGQTHPGESQVNGHAAALLFGQPIRVHPA